MSYDPRKTVAENLQANGYRYQKPPEGHPDLRFEGNRHIYKGDEFVGSYPAETVLKALGIRT